MANRAILSYVVDLREKKTQSDAKYAADMACSKTNKQTLQTL